MPHPPCSPDLAPSDFLFLFPWMKKVLKGNRVADVDEVKQKMTEAPKGIRIDKFKNCLSSGKNISLGVLHPVERTLRVTEV